MDDLSNIFDECERYLRTALNRWRKQLPDLYEDAFQEGMIQCWRDVEAGMDIKLKILRRASMSANKFMHRNGEYYFGKPRKSRDGLRTNGKTVEKVQLYLKEQLPLRNNVWPTPTEVANDLGILSSSASQIMKNIREGRIDHMVYREDGRMDWNFYKTMSVEVLNTVSDTDKEIRQWTDDVRFSSVFEDETISAMDMQNIMMQLNERHRTVLYLHLYEGYTSTDIGRWAGHTTNISTKGARHVNNALNQASILLQPYVGSCAKGHVRNEQNTKVKKRVDGVYTRACMVCQSESGTTTVEKQKRTGFKTGRKEKSHCPKGHKKDVRDSRGALRCSQCRAEAQRAYTARQKAKRES